MDSILDRRLRELSEHNSRLKQAEGLFLELDANKKALYSQLFLRAAGKSVAEKEANVYASNEWRDFMAGLVQAQTEYNFEKRRHEILHAAYLAEHATFKREAELISRGAS